MDELGVDLGKWEYKKEKKWWKRRKGGMKNSVDTKAGCIYGSRR